MSQQPAVCPKGQFPRYTCPTGQQFDFDTTTCTTPVSKLLLAETQFPSCGQGWRPAFDVMYTQTTKVQQVACVPWNTRRPFFSINLKVPVTPCAVAVGEEPGDYVHGLVVVDDQKMRKGCGINVAKTPSAHISSGWHAGYSAVTQKMLSDRYGKDLVDHIMAGPQGNVDDQATLIKRQIAALQTLANSNAPGNSKNLIEQANSRLLELDQQPLTVTFPITEIGSDYKPVVLSGQQSHAYNIIIVPGKGLVGNVPESTSDKPSMTCQTLPEWQ